MKAIDVDISEKPPELPEGLAVATKHHKFLGNSSGFTLVELIVVAAILGVLAGLAIPAYNQFMQKVKTARAISEIRGLETDITAEIVNSNTLPNSLNDIGRGSLLDPWGRPYEYLNFANLGTETPRENTFGTANLNTDFDLYSRGPDDLTDTNIKHADSLDDVVRVNDGGWIGTGENF